ncbi:hypothetical protein OG921_16550 [Aldersonia sp. NBC_00410]|uniref:hypothetical protein n=1 Tax=Aldersonia sp. NBC_00410 TaxID=2975954 RepID=UPI0022545B77|nr:hypothetical protein [Aldersonia sp. NBC_00410]MCX5044777.1 hypothetical protein [Aldersonia sp. NBC_00410]
MRTRNYAAVAAMAATAVAAAAGTANAAPAPTTDPGQQIVSNATDFLGAAAHQVLAPAAAPTASAALATPFGTIQVGGGQIGMTGPTGTVSVSAPLAPVSAALAPVAPALLATADSALPAPAPAAVAVSPVAATAGVPGVTQVAGPDPRFKTWQEREQWEFNRMKDTISIGATVGTATGLIVGGVTGCVVGLASGAVVTGPLAPLGGVAGCAAGAAGLGTLGALTGAVLVTVPVAIGAGINYLVQTQQPFTAPPAAK